MMRRTPGNNNNNATPEKKNKDVTGAASATVVSGGGGDENDLLLSSSSHHHPKGHNGKSTTTMQWNNRWVLMMVGMILCAVSIMTFQTSSTKSQQQKQQRQNVDVIDLMDTRAAEMGTGTTTSSSSVVQQSQQQSLPESSSLLSESRHHRREKDESTTTKAKAKAEAAPAPAAAAVVVERKERQDKDTSLSSANDNSNNNNLVSSSSSSGILPTTTVTTTAETDPAAAAATAVAKPQEQAESTTTTKEIISDQPNTTTSAAAAAAATAKDATDKDNDPDDRDCIFRNSSIYRKVYVYPNPGERGWDDTILSEHGKQMPATNFTWPWIELDRIARNASTAHYNIRSQNVQYTTELLVREIMIHPNSCLRTYNPDEATLFYVPYLPSTEHHMASDRATNYDLSIYGNAILQILDKQDYSLWETYFGLTSKYWQRRNGSDHILVFSEPMHGLWHPRNRRGNYHFVHSQKQLNPPIVISVELSTAFVEMYPTCAAKNILVPYPNTHGDWFNGIIAQQAYQLLQTATNANVTLTATSHVALTAERQLAQMTDTSTTTTSTSTTTNTTAVFVGPRPVAQFYAAGNHGTCTKLRQAMERDYRSCASSYDTLRNVIRATNNDVGMRLTTFCPAPGGDSPSAKRMFDALIAGCIPIILSKDFVWPFTKEFDAQHLSLDPADFSIRLNASDYDTPLLNHTTCEPLDPTKPGLQALLDNLSTDEILRLRRGAQTAGKLFAWYAESPTLPQNPLRDGVLPNGGTAHWVVEALADRASGRRWPACQAELEGLAQKEDRRSDPTQFEC